MGQVSGWGREVKGTFLTGWETEAKPDFVPRGHHERIPRDLFSVLAVYPVLPSPTQRMRTFFRQA